MLVQYLRRGQQQWGTVGLRGLGSSKDRPAIMGLVRQMLPAVGLTFGMIAGSAFDGASVFTGRNNSVSTDFKVSSSGPACVCKRSNVVLSKAALRALT